MAVTPPSSSVPPPQQSAFQPPPRARKTLLRNRVQDALRALPGYFSSSTNIEGIQATDLFSLNTMLGATIEVQVVETLNRMRSVWDPNGHWARYWFERQAQTFPDVLLRMPTAQGSQVALGIELKGWYVLSKESMPSFRYSVTQAASTRWDLLAVVPWHLSNVLAGTPRVGSPWIWPAQHAAAYRNWWWQHSRTITPAALSKHPNYTDITVPTGVTPYQQGSNQNIADKSAHDGGNNFGRIARIGIMDDWVEKTLEQRLAGIPANDWIQFLRQHA